MPSLVSLSEAVHPLILELELDRFLDVYDIRDSDLEFATAKDVDHASTDYYSIKSLRMQQQKLSIIRRYCLCCLLSLPATGTEADVSPWRVAIQAIASFVSQLRETNKCLGHALDEEERMPDSFSSC